MIDRLGSREPWPRFWPASACLPAFAAAGGTAQPAPSASAAGSAADAAYRRGVQALASNDDAAATRAFQDALAADAKYVPAMLGLAELAFRQKQQAQAAEWIHKAVRTNPRSADAQASLGRLLLASGKPKEGEQALRRAMELDTKAVRPRMDLADLLLARGEAAAALPLYREVVAIEPTHAGAHYAQGLALARTGDAARASVAPWMKRRG